MPIQTSISGVQLARDDFRRALSRSMSGGRLGREQLAEAIGEAFGLKRLSAEALNDYTSLAKPDRRFPAEWLPFLCALTGDESPIFVLLSPQQRALLEVGKHAKSAYAELIRAAANAFGNLIWPTCDHSIWPTL